MRWANGRQAFQTPACHICRRAGDFVEVTDNPYYSNFSTSTSILAPGVTQEINYATSTDGKQMVYYLATADIGKRFLQDAENEGFMFRDGVKPTQREADSIFAINDDMTINYVGFVGHVAYQAADRIGNKPLIKIDYRDIINRAE